jgi:hypothetical protein
MRRMTRSGNSQTYLSKRLVATGRWISLIGPLFIGRMVFRERRQEFTTFHQF